MAQKIMKAENASVRQLEWSGAPRIAADEVPVSSIMTSNVRTARPDMMLESVRALLLDTGIGGVPVVDERERPIGMLTKTDLVRHADDRAGLGEQAVGRAPARLGPAAHVADMTEGTVGEAMTPVALVLPENAPISQAAALMAFERVHRLVVVDLEGRVSGLVSALDIVRWLANASGFRLADRARKKPDSRIS